MKIDLKAVWVQSSNPIAALGHAGVTSRDVSPAGQQVSRVTCSAAAAEGGGGGAAAGGGLPARLPSSPASRPTDIATPASAVDTSAFVAGGPLSAPMSHAHLTTDTSPPRHAPFTDDIQVYCMENIELFACKISDLERHCCFI